MSHAASLCLGGSFICVGISKIVELIGVGETYLKKDVKPIHKEKDNTCKQICRIFANALRILAYFTLAVASFTLGATLFTTGPQLGFLIGFSDGLAAALPEMIAAFGEFVASETIRALGS